MKLSTKWLGASIVCALLLAWLPRAHARSLRALVCVEDAADGALLERVRGQTGDLGVRLVAVSCGLSGDFDAQLARAQELTAARRAGLAVWFVRRAQRLVVYVAEPASERVLARGIDEGGGLHAASARDEAAALVVRSAVRAALAGSALDTPVAERAAVVMDAPSPGETAEAERAPEPEAQAEPAAPAEATSPPAPDPKAAPARPKRVRRKPSAPRLLDAWLALRAQAGLDGFASRGRYALGGRLGLRRRGFEAGVTGLAGLPSTRDVELGRLTLSRHRAGTYAAFAVFAGETVRVALEGEAGVELARLRVTRADESLAASATWSVLAYVGAQLRLSYAPRWANGRVAIAPGLGAVVMPERETLGYRSGGAFVAVRRLYAVEPLADVLLAVRF